MPSWPGSIRSIRQAEPVSAGVANRPLQELESRTDYLLARLESATLGEGNYALGVTLDDSVNVGCPVYYDASVGLYRAAYRSSRAAQGVWIPGESMGVLGLVFAKYGRQGGTATADLLLGGRATLDLSGALGLSSGSNVAPGFYSLGSAPGSLQGPQDASGSFPGPVLCHADGQGQVIVLGAQRGSQSEHTHQSLELFCVPAGRVEYPGDSNRVTIDSADGDAVGWLPVDHARLVGLAPAGAVFGYNIQAHGALARIWPLIPAAAARLFWDRGDDSPQGVPGGTLLDLGPEGLAWIDALGIWWMSDCPGDVPWPRHLNTDVSSEVTYYNSSLPAECPRRRPMRLRLETYLPGSGTETVVRSLKPAPGGVLQIQDCDGQTASTGDLVISLGEEFLVAQENVAGHQVLKNVAAGRFERGPVVSGLRAADESILLSSLHTQVDDEGILYQGEVTLQAASSPLARDLAPQIIQLSDVRERYYQGVLYLGFPEGLTASLRIKFKVPSTSVPVDPRFKLRLQLLARASGTLPTLTASYRLLEKPSLNGVLNLPLEDTALTLSTTQSILANQYTQKESESISVSGGDTVLITLARSQGDGYVGEVGLLDCVGVLDPG